MGYIVADQPVYLGEEHFRRSGIWYYYYDTPDSATISKRVEIRSGTILTQTEKDKLEEIYIQKLDLQKIR